MANELLVNLVKTIWHYFKTGNTGAKNRHSGSVQMEQCVMVTGD